VSAPQTGWCGGDCGDYRGGIAQRRPSASTEASSVPPTTTQFGSKFGSGVGGTFARTSALPMPSIAQPEGAAYPFGMVDEQGRCPQTRQHATSLRTVHLAELVGVRVNHRHDRVAPRLIRRVFRNDQGDGVPRERAATKAPFSCSITIRQ
jgi:hypothetical protein